MTGKRALTHAGTAMALALLAMPQPGPAAPPRQALFAPPLSPLILTRTLSRGLPDGKAVTTRRSYQVQIMREGEGYRVDGHLLATEVDAPPSLKALADLERNRPDTGLFPIRLDRDGRILSTSELAPAAAVNKAAGIVADRIGKAGLANGDLVQAQAFVQQIRNRTPQSQWPEDVFHPALGVREESRSVDLPGGQTGRVTVAISGHGRNGPDGIAGIERIVTTDLGGDLRVTREAWELIKAESTAAR